MLFKPQACGGFYCSSLSRLRQASKWKQGIAARGVHLSSEGGQTRTQASPMGKQCVRHRHGPEHTGQECAEKRGKGSGGSPGERHIHSWMRGSRQPRQGGVARAQREGQRPQQPLPLKSEEKGFRSEACCVGNVSAQMMVAKALEHHQNFPVPREGNLSTDLHSEEERTAKGTRAASRDHTSSLTSVMDFAQIVRDWMAVELGSGPKKMCPSPNFWYL